MFLKLFGYKGRFPVDLGGKVINGDVVFEVNDTLGNWLLKANKGLLFETDVDGKPLEELPKAVEEVVVEAPSFPTGPVVEPIRGITAVDPVTPEEKKEPDTAPVADPQTEGTAGKRSKKAK